MRRMRTESLVLGTLAMVLALLTIITALGVRNQEPNLVSVPQEAILQAEKLMEAVHQGDFQTASLYLQGSPDLGTDRKPEGLVGQQLWQAFLESIHYEFDGRCYATEEGLAMDAEVQYLDLPHIIDQVGTKAQELLLNRAKTARNLSEIYDSNNEYRKDVVDEAIRQALEKSLAGKTKTISENLTLRLVHDQGQWLVQPDAALLRVISGGTGE